MLNLFVSVTRLRGCPRLLVIRRVRRGAYAAIASTALAAAVALSLPAAASAASVVHLTNPPDGATFYTKGNATAAVPLGAMFSGDCISGLWYIQRRTLPNGGFASVTGSTTPGAGGTNQLATTDHPLPGDYVYKGSLSCVDPSGDSYTTDFRTIHVVSGYPPNNFIFGSTKLNKRTATLTVRVPGPGRLTLGGNGIVKQSPAQLASASKTVSAAGPVKLTVRAKGSKKSKLNSTGKVTVKAKITFTPTGGRASTKTKTITLKKNLG